MIKKIYSNLSSCFGIEYEENEDAKLISLYCLDSLNKEIR